MPVLAVKNRRGRIKTWLRRALIAVLLLFIIAILIPFIFTGTLLKYALAHSSYRDIPLRFRTAALSPMGALTVRDLEIRDTGEAAGKTLLAAATVRLEFAWTELFNNHLRMIAIDDLDLSLRPGKSKPFTLLQILSPAAPESSSSLPYPESHAAGLSPTPASSPTAGEPFQLDRLLATGHVRLEGLDPWLSIAQVHPGEALPVQLAMTTKPAGSNTSYDLSLTAGDIESTRPSLKARGTIKITPGATTINADQITLQNLQPALTDQLLAQWPTLPPELRRPLTGHVEQLTVSGSATFAADVFLIAAVDLRNLTARLSPDSKTSLAALENFSASTRIAGKITSNPLKDLTFTNTHCSWDNAQWADWRFQHGVADFEVDGLEIVLKDLQCAFLDTPLSVTAAYDTHARVLSRGRLWYNNFSLTKILAMLPDSARTSLPPGLDGILSARVFLTESDSEHIAAHVELACDDQLRYFSHLPDRPLRAADVPDISLAKSALSGTLSWNYRPDTLPEISKGRFIADDLLLYAPTHDSGIDLNAIKADFTFASGIARVVDFYADLPGDGVLSADATYAVASGSLEESSLTIKDAEASMFDPWSPGFLTGTFTLTARVKGTLQASEATLNVTLSPQLELDVKSEVPGIFTVSSKQESSLAVSAAFDRKTSNLKITNAQLVGLQSMQLDEGLVDWIQRLYWPGEGSPLADFFAFIKKGVSASEDKISFTGDLNFTGKGTITGAVALEGIDAHVLGDGAPALNQLFAKTTIAAPLTGMDWSTLTMTAGEFRGRSIDVADNALTNFSGKFAARQSQVTLSDLAVLFDSGMIEGDGLLSLPTRLDALHLKFNGLSQDALTAKFYPDVFSAQGAISGTLSLDRKDKKPLAGDMQFTSDAPGRLKISKQTSADTFAPVAEAAANAGEGTLLPDNFDDIVTQQLADYPYQIGSAQLTDGKDGLLIAMGYDRVPLQNGEPGYAVPVTVAGQKVLASLNLNLHHSITINYSLTRMLRELLGFRDSLSKPPLAAAPKTSATTRP